MAIRFSWRKHLSHSKRQWKSWLQYFGTKKYDFICLAKDISAWCHTTWCSWWVAMLFKCYYFNTYTVRRVFGKSRHPDRMSQNQTGYVTEDVSGIDDNETHHLCRQIPIYRKIPMFFRGFTLIGYIHFPTKSEKFYSLISDYSDDIGKFQLFTMLICGLTGVTRTSDLLCY